MNNGFDLNVKVWKLIEGEIEELKYDGKIFTVKKDINKYEDHHKDGPCERSGDKFC